MGVGDFLPVISPQLFPPDVENLLQYNGWRD